MNAVLSWFDLNGALLLARFFLVVLFPFSTLDKIFNYKGALKQAESTFLPGGAFLLLIAGCVEIGCSACILFGLYDRLAAFILAGYCAVTALLYHQFWAQGDFFQAGESKGRTHFWDFLKNFGLVGGLLLLILLQNALPVSTVIRQPLSAAPMTASPEEKIR